MLFIAASLNAQAASRPDTTDLYRWLEEVNGGRAMSWVKRRTRRPPPYSRRIRATPTSTGKRSGWRGEGSHSIPHLHRRAALQLLAGPEHVRGIWRSHDAGELRNSGARSGPRCWTSTRSRPPRRRTGSGKAPTARSPPTPAVPRLTVRRWRGCRHGPRVRPSLARVRDERLRAAAWQAERRPGPATTPCSSRANGSPASSRPPGTVHRQAPGARPAAVARRRDVPRHSRPTLGRRRSPSPTGRVTACSSSAAAFLLRVGELPRTPAGVRQLDMPRKARSSGPAHGPLIVNLAEAWTVNGPPSRRRRCCPWIPAGDDRSAATSEPTVI